MVNIGCGYLKWGLKGVVCLTAWHTYLSRGPRLWNPFLLAMSLAKAGGSGCPEMKTIINIKSFIMRNIIINTQQTNRNTTTQCNNHTKERLHIPRIRSQSRLRFTMWRVEVYEEMVCEDVLCGDARRGEEESGEQGEEEDGEMSWGPPPPCSSSSSSSLWWL